MDIFSIVIKFIEKDCYMVFIDFKDVYYFVFIIFVDRKYFCFMWWGLFF